MEVSRETAPQGSGSARLARGATFVLLAVAALLLVFGLGYGVSDLTSDEVRSTTQPTTSLPAGGDPEVSEISVGAAILDEIFDILQRDFVDRKIIDETELRDAAIRGAIASLNDPHTEYLTPGDLATGALDLGSTYEGIGASVSDRTGVVQIVAPFRGSPAELAGIRPGDIILAVNGEPTDGWSDQQAVQQIRGPRGTTVILTVRHTDIGGGAAGPEVEDVTIIRGEILIQSVFTEPILEVIPGESGAELVDRDGELVEDIFYIHIAQFHDETPNELRAALADVENGQYIGLIIDVRANPGGLLRTTVEVADEFMDGGVVLTERDADGETHPFGAFPGGVATNIPLIIIQNGASASGSEVLAAALADNGRATIVGTRSFGKGTVNQLRELTGCGDPAGCGALYVSVGRWQRPSGGEIEGIGIRPDFEIAMTGDDYIDFGDLQIFAAIDLLRGNELPPPPVRPEAETEGSGAAAEGPDGEPTEPAD